MSIAALALALILPVPNPTTLRLVHGDEGLVRWLDRDAARRIGDRVRFRVLNIRHANQAFWATQEIDCAAGSWALIGETRDALGADERPPLDGPAHHMPIRRDDRSEQALRNAVCDGVFIETGMAPVGSVAAAVAALEATKRAAVRARPLELIVLRGGASPMFMDRATLEGGGPQWEVRSLTMTRGRGLWSGWMVTCDRSDLALDLQWSAPMQGGSYGSVTRDRTYGGRAAGEAGEAALVRVACDPAVWERPVHATLDAALEAARANPR